MKKKFYIKERNNPQLGTYYVPMGELSKTAAKKHESPLYGDNTMLGYETEFAYEQAIKRLKQKGERVH